ncbi:hypothetical protein [Spirillospora sp. NPDC029432]|uniref:hypothetical protein n=1 Tax=Spirillospora sp. NPDC029432 TaxID=3154599 RepID=UPI003456E406
MPARDTTRTAAILRNRRNTGGYTVTGLAERIREVAPERIRRELPKPRDLERTIRGHEAADHGVGPRYRLLYALAYGTTENELFTYSESESPDLGSVQKTDTPHDWGEMERRRLLQLAILSVGAGGFASLGETARQLLDAALTSAPRGIDDWYLACADHLYALRTRPPQEAREDLVLDLFALQRQIQGAGDEDTTELLRVLAALSTLHGNILTRLGEHGAAIRWWRTGRTTADATGDLDLRLMVRRSEAGAGLYGQRDPATVLHLTRQVQQIAGSRPSLGVALIAGTQAKALSLLGRHAEAKRVLRGFVNAAPDDWPSDLIPAYWTSDQIRFTQSWVHAAAGEEQAADTARDQVLAHPFLDYQYIANVRLHEALCTVATGGVDQGARQAAAILDGLPGSYRSQMITETGRTVLRAVPAEKRERPAVREFADVLTRTAPAPQVASAT